MFVFDIVQFVLMQHFVVEATSTIKTKDGGDMDPNTETTSPAKFLSTSRQGNLNQSNRLQSIIVWQCSITTK